MSSHLTERKAGRQVTSRRRILQQASGAALALAAGPALSGAGGLPPPAPVDTAGARWLARRLKWGLEATPAQLGYPLGQIALTEVLLSYARRTVDYHIFTSQDPYAVSAGSLAADTQPERGARPFGLILLPPGQGEAAFCRSVCTLLGESFYPPELPGPERYCILAYERSAVRGAAFAAEWLKGAAA